MKEQEQERIYIDRIHVFTNCLPTLITCRQLLDAKGNTLKNEEAIKNLDESIMSMTSALKSLLSE